MYEKNKYAPITSCTQREKRRVSSILVTSTGFLDTCSNLLSFRHILTRESKETPSKETKCNKNKGLRALRDYKVVLTYNKIFGKIKVIFLVLSKTFK